MRTAIILIFTTLLTQALYSQDYDRYKNERFFNITKFSYINVNDVVFDGFGTGENNFSTENSRAYSLQTIGGYFLNSNFSVGVGIGLDGYNEPDFNTLPLFIDLRGYFVDGKNSAFAFLDVGTVVKASDSYREGRMLEIGIGYKFFAASNIAMIGSINGSFKGLSLTDENYTSSDRTVVLKGIGFSIGFIF
tara:strand:+ start:11881 stop:12453 length:573 start_codon:yes stop_codon:yes gene_type:complete